MIERDVVWPWGYSVWQIAGFELAHFTLSFFAVLLVVSPVAYLTWITYLRPSDGDSPSSSTTLSPAAYSMAVACMVLLSLSVGLIAHVLEDILYSWF